MPTNKNDGIISKASGSSHEELLGFVLGKPNMIRGRLDTIEEITVLSTAMGIQNMLGLGQTTSQKEIQQKLTKRFTTESKTRLTFNDMPLNHLTSKISKIDNEEYDILSESSLKSHDSIYLDKLDQMTAQKIQSHEKMKRKKAILQMNKLAEQAQAHMQNPFQYSPDRKKEIAH